VARLIDTVALIREINNQQNGWDRLHLFLIDIPDQEYSTIKESSAVSTDDDGPDV
jgi:hypothetical protein